MKVILFNGNRLTSLILPNKIEGSFWLTDDSDNFTNIINIESEDNRWIMKQNDDAKIIFNNAYVASIELIPDNYYFIDYDNRKLFLYVSEVLDETIKYYQVPKNTNISVGKDLGAQIIYNNDYIFNDYIILNLLEDGWYLTIKDNSVVYVNSSKITVTQKKLNYGDNLFILGMKICLLNGVISINNPQNRVELNYELFKLIEFNNDLIKDHKAPESDSIKEIDFYKDEDFFFKKPRLRRFVEEYDLALSPPPSKSQKEEMPLLLTLGPMLTMAVVSVVTFLNMLLKLFTKQQTLAQSLPSLITSGAMLLSSLLWPNLTKKYQKKREKEKERERVKKYREYIERKRKEIYDESIYQSDVLKENLITASECESIILKKKRSLWERRNDQKDFLTVRVGIGKVPLNIKVNFNKEDFTMEEDELKKEAETLVNEAKILPNMPVSYSFYNKKVTAIMGKTSETFPFMDNLLLQLMAFHSYDDLKIVFFVSKQNLGVWDKYRNLPHCFSDNKQVRFFATTEEEIKYVSSYLEQEYFKRAYTKEGNAVESETKDSVTYSPYYLIITDDYLMIRKIGIINYILNDKTNYGFGFTCIENRLGKLPSECVSFISIAGTSAILSTDINDYYQQDFDKEINTNLKIKECCNVLSNIPIEFVEDLRSLPTALGFLEMFNVGKVEHLNPVNRWRLNDPIKSLRAQVGINDEGKPIYLDLHEKFHGPHGLIAGTTGSGKSEFIITYILSMIVNYSPNEIAFILIDYKGGGLAGAFENKTQGIRLPHLAGTITNLDKASLNRTLVSIDSELKRRQTVFNEVRDKLGESTIDIYKYQKFFREGKIDEPMPHLFIISDEFAELKSQQPEFMDDLISAARIGRSLGVHLILATQKPSGVVNDQIWSNTKFRVCLKVQDRSDSNEMLKKPDAADITNAGRFYLQVGNDEIFVLGQSGWAGTQYTASDSVKKKYDRSISYIDDVGNVVKSLAETKPVTVSKSNGDELSNVMKYICALAKRENVKAKNLWLDSIPENIYVDDLIKKYSVTPQREVTAILGEYDAPSSQYQDILKLTLDDEGNTLVIGAAGTNREMFISSIIYSICTNYKTEDVNLYIADFGSEALRVYERFPQVGDILYSQDGEKLMKLISLINDEIQYRKKLFADYNGEYKIYCKNAKDKIPLKVIIINNYESFKENFVALEDVLVKYTREGARYGIIFIISAANYYSIVNRVRRNFNHNFVLEMPDRSDYMDVLGKIGNVYPAEFAGRGLYKESDVYEFQTAQICEPDNLVDFVKQKIEEVSKINPKKAPNIPVLPEEVTLEMFDNYIKSIKELPVGISKKKLKPVLYDFNKDKATVISSKNILSCMGILKTIIYGVRKLNNMVVLIDTEQELSDIGGMVNTYVDKNFEEFILRFEEFLDKEIDGKNINVICIIAGLEKFQGSMNEKKFKGFFNGIKTFPNVNLIFVDSSFKLKKVGFESWYTSTVSNSNGIWVGTGFADQAVFTCNDYSRSRGDVDKLFAYVVKNGESDLIKIVGKKEEEDEE